MTSEHEQAIFVLRKEKARLRLETLDRIRQHKSSRPSEFGARGSNTRATLNIMVEREEQQRQLDAAIEKLLS